MRTILTIALKDLHLLWRDRIGFFWWIVGFPLMIAIFMGSIFGGVVGGRPRPIEIAIVDEASSPVSEAFVAGLERTNALAISRLERTQAEDAVRRGKLAAFIVLKKGFRITPSILAGQPLPLAVGVDPSRTAAAAYLQGILKEAAAEFLRSRWSDPERRPEEMALWLADLEQEGRLDAGQRRALEALASALDGYFSAIVQSGSDGAEEGAAGAIESVPVTRGQNRPQSAFEICFPLGIIWGLLGLTAQMATASVREREAGTLMRLRAAPISRAQVLLGNGVASFLASVGVMLMLLLVGRFIFSVRLQNLLVLTLAVVCTAACFVGLMMMLSVLGRTQAAVAGASWAILLMMSMLGGGMVPQIFMPEWTEVPSRLSPVKWALMSLEAGIWRDLDVADLQLPCAMLLVQGVIFGVIGTRLVSRAEA